MIKFDLSGVVQDHHWPLFYFSVTQDHLYIVLHQTVIEVYVFLFFCFVCFPFSAHRFDATTTVVVSKLTQTCAPYIKLEKSSKPGTIWIITLRISVKRVNIYGPTVVIVWLAQRFAVMLGVCLGTVSVTLGLPLRRCTQSDIHRYFSLLAQWFIFSPCRVKIVGSTLFSSSTCWDFQLDCGIHIVFLLVVAYNVQLYAT